MTADLGRLMQQARAASSSERLDAVRQLSLVEAPDAMSILQALGATDPDRQVRLEASRAARELRTRLSSGTLEVASQSGTGPPALARRLQSPEPAERAKALFGCLRYESEKVLSAILDLLQKEASAKVRAVAVAAVGVLGSASEVEPVKRFLADPDEGVRAAADEALAKLGELSPMPDLRLTVSPSPAARPPAAATGTTSGKLPIGKPAVPVRPPGLPGAAPAPPNGTLANGTRFSSPALPRAGSALPPTSTRVPLASSTSIRTALGTSPMAGSRITSPFAKAEVLAMAGARGRGPAGPPLADSMTPEEKTKMDRLLSSLRGGVMAQVEKDRLAERGMRLYQEIAARLGVPGLPPEPARALYHLAAGNKENAVAGFRATKKEFLLLPLLQPYLLAAVGDAEAHQLKTVQAAAVEAASGRDLFPPEMLEVIFSALRIAKGLMNELDVPERTKLRIQVDELKDYLDKGNVEEGTRAALLLKRQLTRLRFAEKKPPRPPSPD